MQCKLQKKIAEYVNLQYFKIILKELGISININNALIGLWCSGVEKSGIYFNAAVIIIGCPCLVEQRCRLKRKECNELPKNISCSFYFSATKCLRALTLPEISIVKMQRTSLLWRFLCQLQTALRVRILNWESRIRFPAEVSFCL